MGKQAFTVIGRCVSPAGKETGFVLNNVPGETASAAAHAAVADMKRRVLGYFDTPEAAHVAYLETKRSVHTFGGRHV